MKTITLALLALITPAICQAAHANPEKYYQNKWCAAHNGQVEVTLPDKTRADCITSTHAIEFDFGKKWAEAIGQALYYSLQRETCWYRVDLRESNRPKIFHPS